jgi:hypothetical protein
MDHSGWRALEAAGIEVERRQARPEVDVQPLAPKLRSVENQPGPQG